MDKKFLNKVVYHIVKETRIDYTRGRVRTPFPFLPFLLSSSLSLPPFDLFFSEHCENVYGLNNKEIDYVWKEYKDIIDNKIIKELA
jgi:hypothetical protein